MSDDEFIRSLMIEYKSSLPIKTSKEQQLVLWLRIIRDKATEHPRLKDDFGALWSVGNISNRSKDGSFHLLRIAHSRGMNSTPSNIPKPACETCRFWDRYEDEWVSKGGLPEGDCHRYPPHPWDDVIASRQWVLTEIDDWCGEYQPKK